MVFSLRLIMVMVMVLSLAKNPFVSVVENSSTDIPLLTIAHGPTDKPIQYSISGRDKDFFNLKDRVVSFKNSPDYESKPSYSLTLEIKNAVGLILKKLLLLPAVISKPVTMPVVATVPTGVLT
jgi:hypothetical protein